MAWFEKPDRQDINALLIHEFAHHFCIDHLDEQYHQAEARLGAVMTELALAHPELFRSVTWPKV